MAFVNEAVWDRVVRIVVGAVILYLGFGGVVTGALGIVLIVIGFLLLLTGIFGYSPKLSIQAIWMHRPSDSGMLLQVWAA